MLQGAETSHCGQVGDQGDFIVDALVGVLDDLDGIGNRSKIRLGHCCLRISVVVEEGRGAWRSVEEEVQQI